MLDLGVDTFGGGSRGRSIAEAAAVVANTWIGCTSSLALATAMRPSFGSSTTCSAARGNHPCPLCFLFGRLNGEHPVRQRGGEALRVHHGRVDGVAATHLLLLVHAKSVQRPVFAAVSNRQDALITVRQLQVLREHPGQVHREAEAVAILGEFGVVLGGCRCCCCAAARSSWIWRECCCRWWCTKRRNCSKAWRRVEGEFICWSMRSIMALALVGCWLEEPAALVR